MGIWNLVGDASPLAKRAIDEGGKATSQELFQAGNTVGERFLASTVGGRAASEVASSGVCDTFRTGGGVAANHAKQLEQLRSMPSFAPHLQNTDLQKALRDGMVVVEDGKSLGSSELKKQLQRGKIVDSKPLSGGQGNDQKKILTIEFHGADAKPQQARVVFKPVEGEDAEMALNTGTPAGTAWRRSVATSRLANASGIGELVPDTFPMMHEGKLGSAQTFIEGGFTIDNVPRAGVHFDSQAAEKLKIFSAVTADGDAINIMARRASSEAAQGPGGAVAAIPQKIDADSAFPAHEVDYVKHSLWMSNGQEKKALSAEGKTYLDGLHQDRSTHAQLLNESGIDQGSTSHTVDRIERLHGQPERFEQDPVPSEQLAFDREIFEGMFGYVPTHAS